MTSAVRTMAIGCWALAMSTGIAAQENIAPAGTAILGAGGGLGGASDVTVDHFGPISEINDGVVNPNLAANGFKTESGIGTAVSIRDGGVYTTDRVPIGQNIVTIETESLQFGSPHLYVKIPAKYADPSKSGLTIDVKPGENANVDFKLTK